MGAQVELLTKNKQPYETEYIDFEYNGKKISDFGLVVVSNGDRLSFGHSPTFEDEITEVNGYTGQLFWGTHFKNIQRTFQLATDGMTETQWNAFKRHFVPGRYGKFIENHLASRYSYCRVREISVLNIVPFKETVELFGEQVDINIYKGSCSISFEWDEPSFFSVMNVITDEDTQTAIRAMYTNGVPKPESWQQDNACCIGDETYSLSNGQLSTDIDIDGSNVFAFYNPSIIDTNCKIQLTLKHALTGENFNTLQPIYFNTIGDSTNGGLYNEIIIYSNAQSPKEKALASAMRYCAPDIFYQVNRAIEIAYNYYNNTVINTFTELEELLREEITNPKVMGWAANAVRAMCYSLNDGTISLGRYTDETGILNKEISVPVYGKLPNKTINNSVKWPAFFNLFMLKIFAKVDNSADSISTINLLDEELPWEWPSFVLIIDSNNNESVIKYSYNQIINTLENISDSEENCGNIILSNYLKLDGGDTLDNSGKIASYHAAELKTSQGLMNTDIIEKINLFYKYTYL